MNILFCTDGSKISFNSLDNYIKWKNNFTLDLLSVADLGVVPDNKSLEASEFAMYCSKSVDDILDQTERYFSEKGLFVNDKNKMCGSVTDSILEIEGENPYDLIVLGSNGKKGLQKWIGSVSQDIAALSKTSVYISKNQNNAHNVLFTVDSTNESFESVKKAVKFLNLNGKDVYLTTVYEIPDYVFLEGKLDNNWLGAVEKQQQKAASELLDKFETLFNNSDVSIHSKTILKGSPATEIIKYVKENEIDLVVSGMRKKKYLSRFILGSVSKRILENVDSDMLIIKL